MSTHTKTKVRKNQKSILFEDELEEVMSLVKEKMENFIKMDVPLIVEGNYAKNWCELK